MISLKGLLRSWLVPEYEQFLSSKEKIDMFMESVAQAQREIHYIKGENVVFNKPVVFVGSLVDCKVDIKPTLKPEIILSKLDMKGALLLEGTTNITGCNFTQHPVAVKLSTDPQE